MKHFVGMKKEQGLVATVSNFNRWFGDAESEDLRKNFKATEKANLAEKQKTRRAAAKKTPALATAPP